MVTKNKLFSFWRRRITPGNNESAMGKVMRGWTSEISMVIDIRDLVKYILV